MQKKSVLFLSSEHASNAVPEFLKAHFKSKEAKAVLKTHRGYDIGAGDVFWELAKILRTSYAIQGAYTRLAIDLNRNSNKNHRYSEFTEQATDVEKHQLRGNLGEHRASEGRNLVCLNQVLELDHKCAY